MSHTISKNGVPIRLPDERWAHIMEEHAELANMCEEVLTAVANPERILAGDEGELLAVKTVEDGKWIVVAYQELEQNGFIITAFLTRRERSLEEVTAMSIMYMHEYLKLLPAIKDAPTGAVWMHYDVEADVLYVNFSRPSVAADSELTDDDVIIRYNEQDQVISYTILHAQQRSA